jgi:hypothetical protein
MVLKVVRLLHEASKLKKARDQFNRSMTRGKIALLSVQKPRLLLSEDKDQMYRH